MSALIYPPSPMSVDERIIRPSKSFKKSIASVIMSMVLFLAAYILLFAAAVVLVFLMAFIGITLVDAVGNFWVAVISIGLVLSSIMLLYFLIKFIFKKPERDYSTMLEITEDEQPRLFQFLRQLTAETKSPFPKKVYISADVNASVFYDASFWNLFFPAKKNLNIGLGLVNTLNTSEFKAVMAHEFGHFSQRSMKLGVYVYNMHHAIHNLVYDNEKYEDTMRVVGNLHWSLRIGISMNLFLVKQIQNALAGVYRYVNKRYMQLSREMEFNADAIAAFAAGSNHMIKCLRRMEIAAFCFDQMFIFLQTLNSQKKRPANVYPHHQASIRFFAETRQLPTDEQGIPLCDESTIVFNKTRINIEDQWASHPTLTNREDKLHNINLPVSTTNISAWSIFNEPEKLQIAITNIIYSNTQDRPEAVSDEIINEAYISYNNEQSLNKFYRGYYDGRLITAFNVDESLQKKWLPIAAELAFTEEKYDLPLKINALTADIALLDYVTAGNEIKTFDFGGAKYDKSEADEIQSQLVKELEDAENDLKRTDEEIFRYFYLNSTDSDAIANEYKAYFDEQEKAIAYLDSYTNMMAAVNPMFSTMRFDAIEEAMETLYSREEKFKPKMQQIFDNEHYKAVINNEQAKHMRVYLSNDWKYFISPDYDEPSILVLTQALSAFYDVIRDRLFACKKQLTDRQLSLLMQ
jgi:Zn-dependent protease with chaperone function